MFDTSPLKVENNLQYWQRLHKVLQEETYKLSVPQPVPQRLFWSVTVYDSRTRSMIQTDQNKAALRSLIELKSVAQTGSVDLYFGPTAPAGKEASTPGEGWLAYFRLFGPEGPAFDGS